MTADAFDRMGVALADRANPIVVKEVRQGLRGKSFALFFSLLLGAAFFIALIGMAEVLDKRGSDESGRACFMALFVCLSTVQFFIIPYSAYRGMARERDDETWVLLTLTGLGPRRIVGGKVASAMLQGLLYSAAAAPFCVFSYFLNGIDLLGILAALALGLAFELFLVVVAVSAATLAESRLMRGLLHFVVLGGLLWAWGSGLGAGIAISNSSRWSFDQEEVIAVVAALWLLITTAALLFEAAVSRLSLASQSYAKGPRLAFLVQFAGGIGLAVWVWLSSGKAELLAVGSGLLSAYALGVGLFVSSDIDGMSAELWRKGGRWSLLQPGALRGYTLVVLSLAAVAVCCVLPLFAEDIAASHEHLRMQWTALAAPVFALLFLSMAHVAGRKLGFAPRELPIGVRLAGVVLVAVATGLPPMLGAFARAPDHPVLNLMNPVLALVNLADGKAGVELVLINGVLAAVFSLWAFVLLRVNDRGASTA
jgi:hypothetical protein